MAAKGKGGGAARRAKVERRKKRAGAKREGAARRAARAAREEEDEEAADLEELAPFGALFAEGGPLARARFDLSALPREAPSSDPAGAVAEWYFEHLPDALATERWRKDARALLEEVKAGLEQADEGAPGPSYAPDAAAVGAALVWLDEPLATGKATFFNTLFRFVFDRSCEAGHLDGTLPAWVADAMSYAPADVRAAVLDRRHERLSQRMTLGSFHEDLAPDDMPSAAAMLSGPPLEPARFASEAALSCERDMAPERRAATASRLREAAAREAEAGRILLAFDLETLARALGSQDPVDQGLVRLYYARSVYRRRAHGTAATDEWPVS